MPLTLATRKSPLALRQAEMVAANLAAKGHQSELLSMTSEGDRFLDSSLESIGGKGLFTKEIDAALLEGRADIAVHSAKDLETTLPDGITLGAVLSREDARDVLISKHHYTPTTLPDGAKIGTASLRRKVQMLHHRPDLHIEVLRGNVQTRLKKIEEGQFDATLLAYAGLKRLNINPLPGVLLSIDEMLPAVAQGAIALTCRTDDTATKALLATLNDPKTFHTIEAERALLAALDGSCRTPIAGYATLSNDEILMKAMLADTDINHINQPVFAEIKGKTIDRVELGQKLAAMLKKQLQSV